jgi:hypothetical protein
MNVTQTTGPLPESSVATVPQIGGDDLSKRVHNRSHHPILIFGGGQRNQDAHGDLYSGRNLLLRWHIRGQRRLRHVPRTQHRAISAIGKHADRRFSAQSFPFDTRFIRGP